MQSITYTTPVGGMTCRPCEDTILEILLSTKGVINSDVSYWNATVTITYDPELTTETNLCDTLTKYGYPPCKNAHSGLITELITILAAICAVLLIPRLPLPEIPQLRTGASLLFLFLVGIITGTHCICMCGGIILSQISTPDMQTARRPVSVSYLKYQGGRLLISTILGAFFGAAGTIFSYSVKAKSMIYTISGFAVIFIGLCMWGIIPALRKIQTMLPAMCKTPKYNTLMQENKPFVIGLLNGLLPCAASSAMWLYAASCSNPVQGAISMLVWCLGTMPFMSIFMLAGRLIPQKWLHIFERISVILMLAMGLSMMMKGIRLF